MKELARLVALNAPKLIIFIGEALVGNDGIDQLTKFNSALMKYSQTSDVQREIDAILVSKFDTVDEKGTYIFALILSRSCYIDDPFHWQAYLVLRYRPEVPQLEET